MAQTRFRALFTDVGGVLGTNGWDTALRLAITDHFGFDRVQTEARHRLVFDTYERGYLTFSQYLTRVFLAEPGAVSVEDLRRYAYDASVPWTENIQMLDAVKERSHLKLGIISNEGEGLTEHRVQKFGLRRLADFMVFSHFVHMRKPDPSIWKLASQLAQVEPRETIYIDDRELFVEIAADLGFKAIHHVSLDKTQAALGQHGV